MVFDIIAIAGLLVFWASLLWLPLTLVRAIRNDGTARRWSLLSFLAFGVVLVGFTRAMTQAGTGEALFWSASWAAPLALALAARADPMAVFRRDDKWVGIVVVVTFLFALPFLPAFLHMISDAIW